LINECKTVGTINLEIIARINQIGDETTQFKNYYIQSQDEPSEKGMFLIEEVIEELPRSSILENWKKGITLKKPIDLFNDKIDFNCSTFKDICRLNESMLGVIDKFIFLDPKRALSELQKYKANFEILQQSLGEVEATFYNVSSEFSKLTTYQNEVKDINERVNHIFLNPDIIFGPRTMWQTPCTSHTINNNRATLIQSQYGCLLSTRGFTSGVHKWTLRLISCTSTCMIGVAPATVSKTGAFNNYSSNGFYMDLNDGTLYSGPPFSYSNRQLVGRGLSSGTILIVTLNFNARTLTYTFDGKDYLAYSDLPTNNKLYLAWDNNTTSGSEIEITSVV